MTDQNSSGQPSSGSENQETWRAPNSSWQKPADVAGQPGFQSSTPPAPPPGPIPSWGSSPPGQEGSAWPPAAPAPAGGGWGSSANPDSSWPGTAQQWPQGGEQWAGQQAVPPGTGWQQQGGYAQPGQQQPGGYPGQQPGGYPGQQHGGYPGGPDPYQQQGGQAGYNQGGYPPPAGTWQPGPGQPGGRPPGSRRNPALIIIPLAVVAAIVVGVVIALAVSGGDSDESTPTAGPSATTLPGLDATLPAVATLPDGSAPAVADPGSTPPVAGCQPVTPAGAPAAGTLTIGGTGTVVGTASSSVSDFEAEVTLHSICGTTGEVTSYSDPPVHGMYYVVNVTVEVTRGDTSAAPSDFYIQTADGSRYDGDFTTVEPKLYTSEVKAGQKVRGNVVIDAPPGHHILHWEPLFAVDSAKFQF